MLSNLLYGLVLGFKYLGATVGKLPVTERSGPTGGVGGTGVGGTGVGGVGAFLPLPFLKARRTAAVPNTVPAIPKIIGNSSFFL